METNELAELVKLREAAVEFKKKTANKFIKKMLNNK